MSSRFEGKVRINLLGGFDLAAPDGVSLAIASKKAQALIAYLALSPAVSATRDKIIGMLWSDRDEEHARNSLRQVLTGLKRDLSEQAFGMIEADHNRLILKLDRIAVDTHDFEKLAGANEPIALEEAARCYRGPLLDGIFAGDDAFEQWASAQRSRLQDLALDVHERLAKDGPADSRVAYARQLVALDPLRESSHRVLVKALSDGGERDLALRQYEVCREMLAREYATRPSAELERLKTAIASGGLERSQQQGPSDRQGCTATTAALDGPVQARLAKEEPSVAVLPLASLSDDAEQAYFADGITADIISELGRFGELLVTAASSSFSFKGQRLSTQDIAAKLGVRYLVEGSVRKAGMRVRISVQLIEAANGNRVWGERYDRDLTDIFAVQAEIASSVAAAVASGITRAGASRAIRAPTENLGAYDYYLRARDSFYGIDSYVKNAVSLLRKAVELDDQFALAHAWLSNALLVRYLYSLEPRDLELALAEALRALALDPHEAWCHSSLGHALIFANRLDEAQACLDKAVELNPNNPYFRMRRSLCSIYKGNLDAALADINEGFRRDPFPKDWYWDIRGIALTALGRHQEAVDSYARMVEVPPWGFGYMAINHISLGEDDKARQDVARYLIADPQASVSRLMRTEPFPPEIRQAFVAALLKAGLPAGEGTA